MQIYKDCVRSKVHSFFQVWTATVFYSKYKFQIFQQCACGNYYCNIVIYYKHVEIASPEITSNALGIRLHKDLRLCWSKSCYRVSTIIIFSELSHCIACGAMTNKLLRGFQGIHRYHKFTVSRNYSLQKPIESYIWLYCEMQDKAKSELIMPFINALSHQE